MTTNRLVCKSCGRKFFMLYCPECEQERSADGREDEIRLLKEEIRRLKRQLKTGVVERKWDE
jgi:hypothetical protein